ncbi:MAG: chemotaxis protein CheW [Deltaproteobacteria bacterium]|nr:chemotaxis protein CheW [Deltaproteobacteria bacterium]
MEKQYVTFYLDDEEYGIEINKIREIIGYRRFTRVPGVKNIVRGLVNLRGVIFPVFDLRLKFNLPPKEYNKFSVIFVLEIAGRIMGIIVDTTSDVISLSPAEILPTPRLSPSVRTEYIRAVAQRDDRLIILLDLERILDEKELEELDATA